MNFSTEQKEAYESQGYVLGPKVLSDDQIARLKDRIEDILADRVDYPELLKGEAATKIKGKNLPSVKIVSLFRHDDVFANIWANDAVSALAHNLMKGPVRLWEDQMIFKPAHDQQALLGWHRDYTFWDHVGPADMGTCWIALDEATEENGCMCVIPGSHRWKLPFTRDEMDTSDAEWLLKRPEIPASADLTPVPCPVPPGHCHFHHCMLFHGSYGNRTDNPRRSYIMHLMPGHTRRLGDDWNERMASVEDVAIGEILQGPNYPELPNPVVHESIRRLSAS